MIFGLILGSGNFSYWNGIAVFFHKCNPEFPGFNKGDILKLNSENGLFEFIHSDNDNAFTVANSVFNALNNYIPSLSKDSILENMSYFEDMSDYEMKDKVWVLERIEELKMYIKELDKDIEDEVVSIDVDIKESKAVWQNIIWEYETFLGMRKLIG